MVICCHGKSISRKSASSIPKGCKSGFMTYWYHAVQPAKLQLVVKYGFWLSMFYLIKICSLFTMLVQHTQQFLAFIPLIWSPYLHLFGTEEANCLFMLRLSKWLSWVEFLVTWSLLNDMNESSSFEFVIVVLFTAWVA